MLLQTLSVSVCLSTGHCEPCSLTKYGKTLSSEYSGGEKLLKPLDINSFRIENIVMDFMVLDVTASNKGANDVLLFPIHTPRSHALSPVQQTMNLQLFDIFFLCISVKIYSYSTLCLMTPYFKSKLIKI